MDLKWLAWRNIQFYVFILKPNKNIHLLSTVDHVYI